MVPFDVVTGRDFKMVPFDVVTGRDYMVSQISWSLLESPTYNVKLKKLF